MRKHSKVSSSTKRRLGGNVVLRLMKCLTSSVSFDIFTDSYFTSFRLFALLEVNNIRATCVLQSSNIDEVIRSVLNFLFFFYDKISQVQKSIKKNTRH